MQITRALILTGLAVVMGLAGSAAPPDLPTKDRAPVPPTNEIVQAFPANDVMKTAWKIQWDTANGYGLLIRNAWFKRGPKDPWMQVLGDARLSEMFVPYHTGSPRFWDISYNFALVTMTKEDAGPFGKLLGDPPVVVQEI